MYCLDMISNNSSPPLKTFFWVNTPSPMEVKTIVQGVFNMAGGIFCSYFHSSLAVLYLPNCIQDMVQEIGVTKQLVMTELPLVGRLAGMG